MTLLLKNDIAFTSHELRTQLLGPIGNRVGKKKSPLSRGMGGREATARGVLIVVLEIDHIPMPANIPRATDVISHGTRSLPYFGPTKIRGTRVKVTRRS